MTEADLSEWSVYADWLLERGDPLGELIAYELTLPPLLDDAQLKEWKARTKRLRTHGGATMTAWCLGHARTLTIGLAEHWRPIGLTWFSAATGGAIANATDFLRSERGRYVEHVELGYASITEPGFRRLMASLPPTCTRLQLALIGTPTVRELETLRDMIPASICELGIMHLPPRRYEPAAIPDVLRILIDDRFDVIDTLHRIEDEPFAEILATDLTTRARTVRIRTSTVWRRLPRERCLFGRPGDGVIIGRASALVLPRWTLGELQQRFGVVPIRTQLARPLPEHYGVGTRAAGIDFLTFGRHFVRRGDAWTIRGDEDVAFTIDGEAIEPPRIATIRDGMRLTIDGFPCLFAIAREQLTLADVFARMPDA